MKLINDFYTILSTESTEGSYICKVRLNDRHDLFRVHFPCNPITPGVCLIQMATEILEEKYRQAFMLHTASSIKFKKTVGPHDEPTFIFTKECFGDGKLSTCVSIEDGQTQYVKMSLQYTVVG
jgi:3-hydroxyacyl-[acyl-carrier-protein] dehydratase